MKTLYENANGAYIYDDSTPRVVVKVDNPERARASVDCVYGIDRKPALPTWALCCGWNN